MITRATFILLLKIFSPAAGWRLHRSPGYPACWASVIPSPAPEPASCVPPPACWPRRSARQRPPPAGRPPAESAEAQMIHRERDKAEDWRGLITAVSRTFFLFDLSKLQMHLKTFVWWNVCWEKEKHRRDKKIQGPYTAEEKHTSFIKTRYDIPTPGQQF